MPTMIDENPFCTTAQDGIEGLSWEHFRASNTYECRIVICPEEGGGFSVHALRLPGAVSEGETEEEAIRNIKEAFRGAITVYRECGEAIPWEDVEVDRPKGSIEKWILVNV